MGRFISDMDSDWDNQVGVGEDMLVDKLVVDKHLVLDILLRVEGTQEEDLLLVGIRKVVVVDIAAYMEVDHHIQLVVELLDRCATCAVLAALPLHWVVQIFHLSCPFQPCAGSVY